MAFSSLINGQCLADSSNYNQGRFGYKVCKITPHHMSGVLTAKRCCELFQNPNRNASANYCIGNDGQIFGCVDENNRAWTSSNKTNDCQAITIEVSNSQNGGQWPVSEAAWNSLVNLCVDICKRYGFRLTYDGTKNGSLTRHNMFANTDCPGPYLQSRFSELANTVNARLDGNVAPTPSNNTSLGIKYICNCDSLNVRTGAGTNYKAVNELLCKTAVRVHEIKGSWARIEEGMWVSNNYLTSNQPSGHYKSMEVTNCTNLNVRKTPNGAIVRTIPNHCVVSVLETKGNWVRIGSNQWVYKQYLK